MAISYDENSGVFLLSTPASTYVMRLYGGRRGKVLLHCGWFAHLDSWSGVCGTPLVGRGFEGEADGFTIDGGDLRELNGDESFSLGVMRQEYPAPCGSDYRVSAFEVRNADGTHAAELFYRAHRVYKGKKPIAGLPATYVESDDEADTLEIDLADTLTGLTVTLVYTVWNTYDAICRHTAFRNEGSKPITLLGAASASVDYDEEGMRLLTLSGAHARERHTDIRHLVPGMQGVASRRGMSGHQQNPFAALLAQDATETAGEVFGMSLVYSGEFTARVEVDQAGTSRAQIGVGGHNFEWALQPAAEAGDDAASFVTPECVMVRSEEGLGGMSRTYHKLYRTRLARGVWRDKGRPIVINNWEATYFDFTEEKLNALAKTAAEEGIECFVLDDGWFGERNDDRRALGDWQVNEAKLPHGLTGLANEVHKLGMMAGLWVEPEMVSPRSNLYRAHPDWCIHMDGRPQSLSRHQLVLDLSRAEVVDYLASAIGDVLSSANIDYIKWDFNRAPAWLAPCQSYKYYLGLYRLLETLVSRFPNVLFESCAGGGGRFDPGMLYYMPQTWTSDNTDALSRVAIQAGSSVVYPASMMSCHVSAVPNHQTGRITPLAMRAAVAMAGTYGYELDLNKLTDGELQEIKAQVAWYKRIRCIVQTGVLYRLRPVWGVECASVGTASQIAGYAAWEHVTEDASKAAVTVVWTMAEANAPVVTVRLAGLDAKRTYRITTLAQRTMHDGEEVSGAEVLHAGLRIVCTPEQRGCVQLLLETSDK